MAAGTTAAGTVVLRHGRRGPEVAVIHRPAYDDWTLPKGRLEVGEESLPECAWRETREETGLAVRLDVPLDVVRYRAHGHPKAVHYWRASIVDEGRPPRRGEVDKVRWVDATGGLRKLSFARDRAVVRQAVALPPTTAVAIARHGKALGRKRWKGGPDVQRPLVTRGRHQARDLVGLLSAYGIDDLRSSAGTRCLQTLEPAAKALHAPLTAVDLWTEETGTERPDVVAGNVAVMAHLAARRGTPLVACGHRPVLPAMLMGLGVEPRPLGTGDLVVAHLLHDGRPLAVEHHAARR